MGNNELKNEITANDIRSSQYLLTDLEMADAEQIRGGQDLSVGDEDEETARMLSTVSVKIRKPGK